MANVQRMRVISPPSLLSSFTQHYLVAIATSLEMSKNKVQIHYLHLKLFRMVKKIAKIAPVSGDI